MTSKQRTTASETVKAKRRKTERDKVFRALVQNGLRFIRQSAGDLPHQKEFAIAHFATGLELLLKARLFVEHWSLIAVSPHTCNWALLMSGGLKTVPASELCSAITTITGEPLKHAEVAFKKVFDHRNRVLHWFPDDDLAALTAEQCRAWHKLYRLLTGTWAESFAEFKEEIESVEKALRIHHEYLQARFDAEQRQLQGRLRAGQIASCPSCRFDAAVLTHSTSHASEFCCVVCESAGTLALFECGHRLALSDLPQQCSCGEEHTTEELAALLSASEGRSWMDDPDDPPTHCGECLQYESAVVAVTDGFICLDCGTRFEEGAYSTCQYCNDGWVGYDTEHSYLIGCEFCDGRIDRDD